mgnify:CR=1 FL=1
MGKVVVDMMDLQDEVTRDMEAMFGLLRKIAMAIHSVNIFFPSYESRVRLPILPPRVRPLPVGHGRTL